MADFCHDYDPGGLGCPQPGPCPPGCAGDFSWDAEVWTATLELDEEVVLGICEGHGCTVYLHRTAEGFFFSHDGAEGAPEDVPFIPLATGKAEEAP